MQSTSVIERVRGKRLIFAASPGRSGTDYLHYLLSLLPGVDSRHEPAPGFQLAMREAQRDPGLARRFWLEQKLPAIAAETSPIYVETSHVFTQGFVESLLDLEIVPDLIHLSRPCREVASSYLALNSVPGRSDLGRLWMLQPGDPATMPIDDPDSLHDYQLCYWFCLEMDRRAGIYGAEIEGRGGRVTHITLADLPTMRGLPTVTRELDLPGLTLAGRARLWVRSHRRRNTKRGFKETLGRPTLTLEEREQLEADVHARIQRASGSDPVAAGPLAEGE